MIDKSFVVKVENVKKKYCKDLKKSLWYGIKDISYDIIGKNEDNHFLRPSEFWALDNISFKLKKGQSLGIIGKNGAGKTTLLKLINGLFKPNSGTISIHGTVGALIALGTGFNPILTGRENVKIAGSVLGFTDNQIEEKLEEILDFSEIGDFIDAPVKSYSSGMLVRLGFSVAVQLNPDLLLVDEVLAVGDLAFMVKCQKKITEYRNSGGSLILVSHGMHNIRFHCDKAIWLEKSQLCMEGDSSKVCDEYEISIARQKNIQGHQIMCDEKVSIGEVRYTELLTQGEPFTLEVEFFTERRIEKPIIVLSIFDVKNQYLISNYSHIDGFNLPFERGKNTVSIFFDNMPLSKGVYNINLLLSDGEVNNHLIMIQNRYRFELKNEHTTFGILSLKPKWKLIHDQAAI